MAEDRYLDKAQARDIEEELFATRRQQASRHMPVPLPRQNFWEMVGKLLAGIDDEIQDMLMNGITGLRLQNAQKRQANILRILHPFIPFFTANSITGISALKPPISPVAKPIFILICYEFFYRFFKRFIYLFK